MLDALSWATHGKGEYVKIAIGFHIQDGPWGGGNQFARSLAEALESRGDQVRFDLLDKDIDLIVLADPRARSSNVSFGAGAILRYLLFHNPLALVIHRINECDERKGSRHMNRLLRQANYCADHTVFIASWLRDLNLWRRKSSASVILNGGDPAIFNSHGFRAWDGKEPFKLVTHHWGGNLMKGFDIYRLLDDLIGEPEWRDRIRFTYIGNLPKGFAFKNVSYLPPMNGAALAQELRTHHGYVTGSMNEPAGMHHIEGALCGLPLLYRQSGALPEYCSGFGIEFSDPGSFLNALNQFMDDYGRLVARMPNYPHTSSRMCHGYLALFDELMANREEILSRRRHLLRNPWLWLRNQVPY